LIVACADCGSGVAVDWGAIKLHAESSSVNASKADSTANEFLFIDNFSFSDFGQKNPFIKT
jgi:hypothetical protein